MLCIAGKVIGMGRSGDAVPASASVFKGHILQRAAAVLLISVAASAQVSESVDPQYMRYERAIGVPGKGGLACAVLDAEVFAHASPSLRDLRVYANKPVRQVPYVITLSEPQQPDTDRADVLNLSSRGQSLSFDLRMPDRPYTEIALQLNARDFVAVASVTGADSPGAAGTPLGRFTFFDLSQEHLGRNTTISVQETSFRFLHLSLDFSPVGRRSEVAVGPGLHLSATVPPSREAQILYTLAAQTTELVQNGKQTLASLVLPQRVPAERVTIRLAPGYRVNFSREVHIFDHPKATSEAASSENASGTILRVHLAQAGREIDQQQLSVPVAIGSNLQGPAMVQVAIDNGDEKPLPITAVRLEMRERRLCFNVPEGLSEAPVLFYGDPAAPAPRYGFARSFQSSEANRVVQLGPEQLNPDFHPRQETRPLTRRHPEVIWVALLIGVGLFAVAAFRSSVKVRHRS